MTSKILYIWQAAYPWEIRAEKVCLALREAGYEVTLLARWKVGQSLKEDCQGIRVIRVGQCLPGSASLPVPLNPVWSSAIRRTIQEAASQACACAGDHARRTSRIHLS